MLFFNVLAIERLRKMKKLTKVLGISEKKDYYPYELSGG